jgi:hypothetical protein
VDFLQIKRKKSLEILKLRAYVLDILIIEKCGQFLFSITGVIKFLHFILVNTKFVNIRIACQGGQNDINLISFQQLFSTPKKMLCL